LTMFLACFLFGLSCLGQTKFKRELPPIKAADFTLPASTAIDSNASAVILMDVGDMYFTGNKNGWFSYVFQRHTRIKILNKKAFEDLATVRLFLYHPYDDPEKLEKVSASTYNLENGQVSEVKLDKKDVFEDRVQKDFLEEKFTMPALREGSIIDYSYTITSGYITILPTWRFQSPKYPCLLSDLRIEIPQTLFYMTVKQGIHAYAVDMGSAGSESYKVGKRQNDGYAVTDNGDFMIVNASTVKHQWVMKDVPAFHRENYLSCPENYMDKLDFQLAKTYDGQEYHDKFMSWQQAAEQLLRREDFGKPLDEDNSLVDACVHSAVADTGNATDQARAIYYYVCHHFTCSDFSDKFIQTTLNDVVRKHSGTVGDINLLLVSMLRRVGLPADPVVLTTREHGFNLASYPVLQRLNYVIARVKIGGKSIYLDAAHSKLGFGQLDGACYNGYARIISQTDSGYVYFEADSLRETKRTTVFITQTDKGSEGSWSSLIGPQESYQLREHVGELGTVQYFKRLQTQYGEDIQISEQGIDSLEIPDQPAMVHYAFTMRKGEGEDKVYLNPFIGAGLRENPFKAAERKYPVEMPNAIDESYVFTMQLPNGYTVEEIPKSLRVSLNGGEGSFEYLIGVQDGMIQMRSRLKLNEANFPPGDYAMLRDWYAMIVKKENETIVLKKN
jgi:hypothetical protein